MATSANSRLIAVLANMERAWGYLIAIQEGSENDPIDVNKNTLNLAIDTLDDACKSMRSMVDYTDPP